MHAYPHTHSHTHTGAAVCSAPALIPPVDLKQHHSRVAHGRGRRLREKKQGEESRRHGREETKVSQGDRGRRSGGTERERREEKTRAGVWKKGKFGKRERQKKDTSKSSDVVIFKKDIT